MWSSWKGKRVDALVRAIDEMGLGEDDVAGKGTDLPQKDSEEWRKLPAYLRILLNTEDEGYIVQWWSQESIDALPERTRRGLRILTYNDVPKDKRNHTMKDLDQWVMLDPPIDRALAHCVEIGMRDWDNPEDTVDHVKSLRFTTKQLEKLQLVAITLKVPSMRGVIKAMQKGELVGYDGEDAGRE